MADEFTDEFNFETEIQGIDWFSLKDHYRRDALFIISQKLELLVVADAMAKDQSAVIAAWLKSEDIRRPSDEEVELWGKDEYKKLANYLIVRPYVLAQLLVQ